MALLALAALALAGPIQAGPDPAHSTVPDWLRVTGYTSTGVPDPSGVYCVTMRDFANNPIAGIRVELDLSACCDINVCTDAIPGQELVSCTPPKFAVVTDDHGTACFHVTGAAKDDGLYANPDAPAGPTSACVRLVAEVLGDFGLIASALAFDQNGVVTGGAGPGVNTLDLSILKSLIQANATPPANTHYRTRANYSGPTLEDRAINVLDLSYLLTQITRAYRTSENSSVRSCMSGSFCTTKVPSSNCP
jgi:hypothetical protein